MFERIAFSSFSMDYNLPFHVSMRVHTHHMYPAVYQHHAVGGVCVTACPKDTLAFGVTQTTARMR